MSTYDDFCFVLNNKDFRQNRHESIASAMGSNWKKYILRSELLRDPHTERTAKKKAPISSTNSIVAILMSFVFFI